MMKQGTKDTIERTPTWLLDRHPRLLTLAAQMFIVILVGLLLGMLGTGCAPDTRALVLEMLAERAQQPRPSLANPAPLGGMPVYGASQCVGPVIMGVCQGSVIGPPAARCYGTMLNGQCTGPMF